MKALLIDPKEKTVTPVNVKAGKGHLKDIYRILECSTIGSPAKYVNGDLMYCDEEAWVNVKPGQQLSGFIFVGLSSPILGKALIIGADLNTGADRDCKSEPEQFKGVFWCDDNVMRTYGHKLGVI